SAGGTGADEVLLRHLPVDHRMTVLNAEGVAGPGHDPLDEVGARLLRNGLVAGGALVHTGAEVTALARPVLLGALGRMADADVPDPRIGEVVDETVHEHALVDVEGWLHRTGRDLVRLDDPVLDPKREG